MDNEVLKQLEEIKQRLDKVEKELDYYKKLEAHVKAGNKETLLKV